MTLMVAVLVGVTIALLLPPRPRTGDAFGQSRRRAQTDLVLLLASGPVAVALVLLARGTVLVLGLIVLAAAAAVARLSARVRLRRAAAVTSAKVVELCEALAAELTAGQPSVRALERAGPVWRPFEQVVEAARLGADVPAAMRRVSEVPGAGGLREVASAWQVAHASGAGLSRALDRVAESARESRATAQLVAGELASAQATARLVAALPVLALVLGSGIGGDPWGFLVATPAGLVCLAVGLALVLLGLSWIERIAAEAVRS